MKWMNQVTELRKGRLFFFPRPTSSFSFIRFPLDLCIFGTSGQQQRRAVSNWISQSALSGRLERHRRRQFDSFILRKEEKKTCFIWARALSPPPPLQFRENSLFTCHRFFVFESFIHSFRRCKYFFLFRKIIKFFIHFFFFQKWKVVNERLPFIGGPEIRTNGVSPADIFFTSNETQVEPHAGMLMFPVQWAIFNLKKKKKLPRNFFFIEISLNWIKLIWKWRRNQWEWQTVERRKCNQVADSAH